MGNDEREQTLNQLLTELDGFESEKDAGPVICIAATNRPDVRSAFLPPEALWEILALQHDMALRQGMQASYLALVDSCTPISALL